LLEFLVLFAVDIYVKWSIELVLGRCKYELSCN